jgi:hypothetical protein
MKLISTALRAFGMSETGVRREAARRRAAWFCFALALGAITCLALPTVYTRQRETQRERRGGETAQERRGGEAAREVSRSPDALWQPTESAASTEAAANQDETQGRAAGERRLRLNSEALTALLARAPMEFTAEAKSAAMVITLPLPDGTLARFSVAESPVMEPGLAAQFPQIKTYQGQGLDDPTATARFDWTPDRGLHAIILSARGSFFVEPQTPGETVSYVTYDSHLPARQGVRHCSVAGGAAMLEAQGRQLAEAAREAIAQRPEVTSGTTLRTYRLAVAATAEYTQQYGQGNVNNALAAITSTVNAVNAIYQREAAIRFTLVANQTAIIFTDPNTDGYTNDNTSTMLDENQAKLDQVIGAANYDVGHVLGGIPGIAENGGSFSGVAGLGVAGVNGQKGRGVSTQGGGLFSPTSSAVVNGVAHELAHQFNVNHTFNATGGACGGQRSDTTSWEPGGGSTIMGYQVCEPENIQGGSDSYFHTGSLEAMVAYSTTGQGNAASQQTPTGNNPPAVNAGADFTVPRGTPFTLTATGSDPDGDAVTYAWEQFDLGPAGPPHTDDGQRPIFRSFPPTASPARTFPQLRHVLAGNIPETYADDQGRMFLTAESFATTTRTLNFRVTARDNRAAGGGVNSAAMKVNVRADAGPFVVTAPAAGATWTVGMPQTITWDVAGTNNAPVNAANVRLTLSTDGGNTFPVVLAESVPLFGTLNPAALPNATANADYAQTLTAGAGTAPLNFTVTAGALPQGLTLAANGQLSGQPQQAGAFNFTAAVTDGVGCTGNRAYTLTVTPAANIGDTGAGGGNGQGGNAAQSASLEAAPASAENNLIPVTFPVALNAPSNQVVTMQYATEDGTATAGRNYVAASGQLVFQPGETVKTITVMVIEATDGGDETDEFFVLLSEPVNAVIGDGTGECDILEEDDSDCPIITFNTPALAAGQVRAAYDQRISAGGGSGIEFEVVGGFLPPGLSLALDGRVTGAPLSQGTFRFVVAAIDVNGCFDVREYAVTVGDPASVITGFFPDRGRVGTTVTVTGARFTLAREVRLGGRSANFVVNSDASITALVPAGATTGPVSVVTPNGSGASAESFTLLNTLPDAVNGTLVTRRNTAAAGRLMANDVDGNALRFEIVVVERQPAGTIRLTNPLTGEFTYTPRQNFVGTDTFFFRVFDGTVNSDLAQVTVTVTGPPPPVITCAMIVGNRVTVIGENFDRGAVILINGAPRQTYNDPTNPTHRLFALNNTPYPPGATVRFQVRNSDDTLSEFFTRRSFRCDPF